MAELTPQISSVVLARDRMRLAVAPAAFLLLAVAAVGGGLVARGPAGIALIGLGGLSALAGIYLASLILSYRLLVEPGGLKLRWLGGERRYRLVRGSVTRVAVHGREAAALHPRFGALGWAVGPAILGGNEGIELIRLSIRPALIVVPTEDGRLAIAAAVESDLLEALRHAVRLQEQLDEAAARHLQPAPAPVAPPPLPAAPPAPRVLTGIERTLIEQRLAAERAAAVAAAAASQAPAASVPIVESPRRVAATAPPVLVPPRVIAPPTPRVGRRRERARWHRPAWVAVPGPATVAAALPVALPLLGAGIAWIAVTVTGRPSLPPPEEQQLLLGLALVGPLGALAGLIARTWYPRLGGLVTASALAGLALLTRTILA